MLLCWGLEGGGVFCVFRCCWFSKVLTSEQLLTLNLPFSICFCFSYSLDNQKLKKECLRLRLPSFEPTLRPPPMYGKLQITAFPFAKYARRLSNTLFIFNKQVAQCFIWLHNEWETHFQVSGNPLNYKLQGTKTLTELTGFVCFFFLTAFSFFFSRRLCWFEISVWNFWFLQSTRCALP